jgi:hypothetical protein
MSEEIQNATPAVQESAEQVHEVESNSSEATTEQTQEVSQETQEQTEQAKKEPWFQKRINEQTRKVYEAKREADALRERLAQYEQRQYQAPEGEEQYQPQRPQVDVESLAEQKAAQMLAERSFNEACNKVYEAGSKELPDFTAAVSNLQLVGVNRDFLDAVTATDAGHKILHHLGQLDNLGEAERILKLPPVQMGRELAKLEAKLSQPVTKPVSKAPAPITPIGAGGATESGLRDDLSIEEWTARRNKQLRG